MWKKWTSLHPYFEYKIFLGFAKSSFSTPISLRKGTLPQDFWLWFVSSMMKLSLRWGTVPVVWHCHGGMALSRWYGTVPVVWHCPGGMALSRWYGTVSVLLHCHRGKAASWNYYTVPEVWHSIGDMTMKSEILSCQRYVPKLRRFELWNGPRE